ncbi:MAG: histidine--tRNA ligase [Candidatus Yanofskybacteria bacterium]|nr:histidine--tRNA ligase [Candidatus Yanofskybacteria bacterium]
MDRIDSGTPSGFRDTLPADAAMRQRMANRIAGVFERFGFAPIDTPALERPEVLTGGDESFSKNIYRARITEDDEPLALRFDLTVPLARFVAAHSQDLQFPFLRYHIGKVWRGEHAQAGRYREFVQCDVDIVGAKTMLADAQIIAVMYAVFSELGLADRVRIRISNRKVLNGLAEFLQFDAERTPQVLRAIDKLDKQPWEAIASELSNKVGLDAQQIDAVQEFISLTADTPEALLDQASALLKFGAQSERGIAELRELIAHLDAFDIPRSAWTLDLAVARGLGYYTGTVFETTLLALPQYGSVCSGGRYDNLVTRFSPMELSGVGTSVGIDRLIAALDELGLLERDAAPAKVAVLNFEPTASHTAAGIAADLRASGISTALYLGNEETLKGQLSWAVKGGFPYVVIMGASEHERGVVQLKDMAARTQSEISLSELAARLSA